jgi:hypothetical protein
MALYLIWAANSPFNRGNNGPNSGGGANGGGGGTRVPNPFPIGPGSGGGIQIAPPNIPGLNPVWPIAPPGFEVPMPNPTDVCNPIYTAIWGDYECRVKQGRQNMPGTQIPYHPIGYLPYGYGSTPYAYVGGGWPFGTRYGVGVA